MSIKSVKLSSLCPQNFTPAPCTRKTSCQTDVFSRYELEEVPHAEPEVEEVPHAAPEVAKVLYAPPEVVEVVYATPEVPHVLPHQEVLNYNSSKSHNDSLPSTTVTPEGVFTRSPHDPVPVPNPRRRPSTTSTVWRRRSSERVE